MIKLAIKRKNLFVLDICILLDKAMLAKKRGRPTNLFSKNPQIRLWYQQLGYTSNSGVLKVSKLN